VTTLRRLLAAAALATRPALPLVAAAAVMTGAPACNGGAKPKVKQPKPKAEADAADLVAAAEAAAKAGDIDGADAKYREAEKLDLKLAIVKPHVKMLLSHGRAPAAVEVMLGYYEANPSDTNGSILYANALIAAKDFDKAAEVAGEVIELAPTDPYGYAARGNALVGAGRAEDGLEDLRKASEMAPRDGDLLVAYGLGLKAIGNVGEAALKLRAAIELVPENALANMHLGILRRAQDDNDEGVSWLTKATKFDPTLAEAWYNLALAQNDMGDNQEAERSAQKAASLAETSGQYWYVYGEMLRINEKPDEAANAYEKALAVPQPFAKAAEKIAKAMTDAGRHADAEVFLTNAITKNPTAAGLFYQLGFAYGAQKKYQLGVEALERYLVMAAKDPKEEANRNRAAAEIKALKRKGNLR
jgi:tetratricopeptide (TPR) repeat protein